MTIDGGYAVGVYVGYDDNKEMRQKTTRITGSVGALPAWTNIINAILKQKEYVSGIDPVDLSFYGLGLNRLPIGQFNLEVAENEGGVFISPINKIDPLDRYHPSIMTFGNKEQGKMFDPSRMYAPFWQNQGRVQ
jgi:membrane peptidoglycan carboxypeptidase